MVLNSVRFNLGPNRFVLKGRRLHTTCVHIFTYIYSIFDTMYLDEETLQDTWIRTNRNNMNLGQTVYYALSLIVQLANFDIRTLKVGLNRFSTIFYF